MNLIGNEGLSLRECEKKLLKTLGPKRIQLIKVLVKNRYTVFYGSILKQAQTPEEEHQIEEQMGKSAMGRQLLMQRKLEAVGL